MKTLLSMLLPLAGCVASDGARDGVVGPVAAATGRAGVDCRGTGDHVTLGAAVAAAADGDTIDVAPCTYREQVDFGGRSVTLRATSGPDDTVIDAGGVGPVVVARSGEGDGTALIGFTLTGGVESDYGAAVVVDLSRLRLENVIASGNRGRAIVYGHSGDIELRDVTVTGNAVTPYGASVLTFRGALDASGLRVHCRDGAHAVYIGHGSALIDASELACPSGTAAASWVHATGRIQRTRLTGAVAVYSEEGRDTDGVTLENDIFTGGGGIYVEFGTVALRNSVVEGSLALTAVVDPVVESNVFLDAACAIDADAASGPLAPRHNTFWRVSEESCGGGGWSGTDGNFAADPLFVDEADGDYTLAPGSPCIDAGPADPQYDDPDGSPNDVGAYGGPKSLAAAW